VGLHGAKGLPTFILYNEHTRYQILFNTCQGMRAAANINELIQRFANYHS
jgi:hypothetical protein